MIREPRVFLYDEPLSNLDARLRVAMRVEIRRLHQRLGTTSLFVTHDQIEAMTLADRIVVMNKGIVEQVGTPAEVYHRPASTYVAGFIGSPGMNLVPGHLDAAAGTVRLSDGQRLAVDGRRWSGNPDGPVTVGFRAQAAAPVADGGLGLAIEFVEELGPSRLVHAAVGSDPVLVEVPFGAPARAGEALRVAVDPGAIALFDAATGRRLKDAPSDTRAIDVPPVPAYA